MGNNRNDPGTGQGAVQQDFVSENIWRALILISSAAVLLVSVYCLSRGITTVFMHLYYFPIVLLAYRYRYRGFVFATLLAIAYVVLVYIYDFGQPAIITGAWYRLIVFVGIAAIVAYLSERLAVAPMFQKESVTAIQKMYQALLSENVWRAVILVSSAAVILFSVYCLSHGITIIFMHLYYFPIVLLAYRYRLRGVVLVTLLSFVYVGLVVFYHPEPAEVIGALCRLAVFIGIAAVVAYLSERLAAAHVSQKERLETIQTLQQFQESIINNAQIWITVLAPDGTIIVWNAAAETMSGYKQDDVLGKRTIWRNLYPDTAYRQKVTREIRQIIKQETYLENFETEIRCADGTQKTIVWNTRGIRNTDGSIQSYIAIGHDITERKKAEQEIERIAREWETTFNATSDGICLIDANQNFIRCNNRMGEILGGIKQEDLVGKPCWEVVHKTTGPIPECPFVSAKKSFKRTRIEIPAGELWFEVTADPVIDSSGTFAGVVHIMRDITDRKQAEKRIRWLASFPELNPNPIIELNAQGTITFANTATLKTLQDLGLPENMAAFVPADIDEILHRIQDDTEPVAYREITLNNKSFAENISLNRDLKVVRIYINDITERKRAEEALRQANKQLNLLSSITRHDILNQLMALKGYLELSKEMIDNPTKLTGYIQKEEQAANTINAQITFTKNYQELGVAAPEWQAVNASIKKAVAELPMRGVRVETDPRNPEVFADRLFEKVFYNLIDNALRYGGADMKTIRVSSHVSGTSLVIVCEDDGVGISADDKKHLFTKGFGKNTGLGLFLSLEILAITGITITENGIPGKGARFEIHVPAGIWRVSGTGE